jgi:hypothetical protein
VDCAAMSDGASEAIAHVADMSVVAEGVSR